MPGPHARTALVLAFILLAAGAVAEYHPSLVPLRFALQRDPDLLPSSRAIPDEEIRRGVPTVSLALKDEDLFDRETGILANRRRRGNEWERPGTISYYEAGKLRYASAAGVRIHGGGSRLKMKRQGFRLYFRRRYGSVPVPGELLFGDGHRHPLRVLVAHNDARPFRRRPWHLVNPLAYDIAEAIGCIVSPTRPVRFLLNGEFQGVYVLSEHVHPRHFFAPHGLRRVSAEADEFTELWRQIRKMSPLTAAALRPLVDVENLTRWFISIVFCATHDPFQAPNQFRDADRILGQWFWVNWDMDGSFRNHKQDMFAELLPSPDDKRRRTRRSSDPRDYLVAKLLANDPEYREEFKRIWIDVMNHRLTEEFLSSRFAYYRDLALEYGITDTEYLETIQTFLTLRPAYLRRHVERQLGTLLVHCRLTTTGPVLVDGYPIASAYEGYYFKGMTVRLDVPPERAAEFAHWRINGAAQPDGQTAITVPADENLVIEAVWR